MEKLAYKVSNLQKAFDAFQNAVEWRQLRFESASTIEQDTCTASVIKHFELCYEMLWKTLKVYLLERFGTETSGSKTVFRACLEQKIITELELAQLMRLVDLRNMTTHVYDENFANEVCAEIIEHVPAIESLISNIQKGS